MIAIKATAPTTEDTATAVVLSAQTSYDHHHCHLRRHHSNNEML